MLTSLAINLVLDPNTVGTKPTSALSSMSDVSP